MASTKVDPVKGFISAGELHYHTTRRKAMLAKYGSQIKALHGTDPRTAIGVVAIVATQVRLDDINGKEVALFFAL